MYLLTFQAINLKTGGNTGIGFAFSWEWPFVQIVWPQTDVEVELNHGPQTRR